jgi:putative membrane protein insertion efficiency factor
VRKIIILFIRFYKRYISPILPNSCRFYPSCSQYAIDAVEKHGTVKGILMASYRILRCNPFNKGGYDPVR